MRNISFAFTKEQFRARTKTVTRRMGWKNLLPGTRLLGVEKGMGLKKGEKIVALGAIVVKDVRRERLDRMTSDLDYGFAECEKEGFRDGPKRFPSEFVAFYCAANHCSPDAIVTRIEFEYQ